MDQQPESAKSEAPEENLSEAEIDQIMARGDGVLGAAGHRVTDPGDREILRRQVSGEISGDEARALLRKNLGLS